LIDVDDSGPVQLLTIELPPVEQQRRQLTLKQKMILAIVRRDYRGQALPSVAAVHRHVASDKVWPAECARRKPPVKLAPPNRDTVARTLRAASLI
jgi:hypothetical protein